jgi:nucleotide-binding universal stress UspA family protein
MKTILAAVDFSPVTDSVLAAARELALAVGGRVLLLHVVPTPDTLAAYGEGLSYAALMGSPFKAGEARQAATDIPEVEREADARLKNLAWSTTGVPVDTSIVTGLPVDEILFAAREKSAAFIVLGLHRHTSLYELLVGSTAHGVLKKAPCQVLLVPAKAEP